MTLWLDAQLSPKLASWMSINFAVKVYAVRELGLRDAEDKEIFLAAKQAEAIIVTKDSDFINLLEQYGTPPQVIWVTCGNTSNDYLKQILTKTLPPALLSLADGEKLVEITDSW